MYWPEHISVNNVQLLLRSGARCLVHRRSLGLFSADVSQWPAAPSFRMCRSTTSFVNRCTSLKLFCPSAMCDCTRVLLWAAWLPNQGDQPLRPPLPCAMPGRRSNGRALGPRLHTKGRTRSVYCSSLVQTKGGNRFVSWC